MSESDSDEILSALTGIYELCLHAKSDAFSNGVTDSTGTIDEGDVIASRYLDEARRIILKFDPDCQRLGHRHSKKDKC